MELFHYLKIKKGMYGENPENLIFDKIVKNKRIDSTKLPLIKWKDQF